ncbi:Methyltransferase TRM13 [Caulifigura coniformis]|uniref:Methyltransferase TRM13 n=1 Tax=Caulifigura coniformis TaxID=2527983 RepID=A0A517SC96_9PLAN|nr:SAM-dependent methyltransferase [Caulifigura coniformis]QDT53758.1 Methyltransferase TRM13 [Caulifigura coniformis]
MASSIDLRRELAAAFAENRLVKLVLARSGEQGVKSSARPVAIKGEPRLQWADRRGKQEVHANLTLDESLKRLEREFPSRFHQVNLLTTDADFEFRLGHRGDIIARRGKASSRQPVNVAHDSAKQYLIPEGQPCAFLEAVGVMTADGRVRAAMQHKFRQINRFLEFVNDVYRDLPADGVIRVVDFGCGKSYLTLAIHHLLAVIHGREVDITGIDRTADVVATCRGVAERLELEGLAFEVGEIGSAAIAPPVHLAVALHACDTATDAALAKAVEWQANVILAAPCCQHEVASQMNAPALELLQTHGILKERFAALATDALRAAALESAGYRTQVIEFIDLDHTPKNLLIRAVRRERPEPEARSRWSNRLRELQALLGIPTTAVEAIGRASGGESRESENTR